jgi:toxin CcdB
MARFDVHEGTGEPLMLDCQADVLEGIDTRLMVPLYLSSRIGRKLPRLNPVFRVADRDVVMLTQSMAAIPSKQIGKRVCSLAHEQDAIVDAIDMLLSGF